MAMKLTLGLALAALLAGGALAQSNGKTITDAPAGLPPSAAAAPPDMASTMGPDLSGYWSVSGTNPDGTSYTGTVTMTRNGPVYDCSQVAGGDPITCTALQSGNSVAIVYDGMAVSLYTVRPDGSLAGSWTVLGANQIGQETWSRP